MLQIKSETKIRMPSIVHQWTKKPEKRISGPESRAKVNPPSEMQSQKKKWKIRLTSENGATIEKNVMCKWGTGRRTKREWSRRNS